MQTTWNRLTGSRSSVSVIRDREDRATGDGPRTAASAVLLIILIAGVVLALMYGAIAEQEERSAKHATRNWYYDMADGR